MLIHISQLSHVGRFTQWDTHANLDPDVAMRPMSLIYARNASGKSTLARVLACAATDAPAPLLLHQHLGDPRLPKVSLQLSTGQRHFDGERWSGVAPKVLVFDRDYIEANVYTGRRTSKDQRRNLLSVALGDDHVRLAQELDTISGLGRKLNASIKPYRSVLAAAAADAGLSVVDFLSLEPETAPAEARARLQRREREALTAQETLRRPQPRPLPLPPRLDLSGLQRLLSEGLEQLTSEASAQVRAHLQGALQGEGEAWVREGLQHVHGDRCPFCAQSLREVDLVGYYQRWFNSAYTQRAEALQAHLIALDGLSAWWTEVKHIGVPNVHALSCWSDLPELTPPNLRSPEQQGRLHAATTLLRSSLQGALAHPLEPQPVEAVQQAATLLQQVREQVQAYNRQTAEVLRQIQVRCVELEALSIEEVGRQRRQLNARLLRHSPAICRAVEEMERLDHERELLEEAKASATTQLKELTQGKLHAFRSRMNHHLQALSADFRLKAIGTERGGGKVGAKLQISVEAGALSVSTARHERQLARVMSDGDRGLLAMAVFLTHVEQLPDLRHTLLVFDDPMASLDSQRSEAVARQISQLLPRCEQVLVLAHQAPFLGQVEAQWLAGDHPREALITLELDRSGHRLQPWSP